jgi:VWFA-related protein
MPLPKPSNPIPLFLALAAFAVTLPGRAQLTGSNKPADADETPTIKREVNLIIETVVVKDKKGVPIQGLAAKDFTVTEDGVPQKISFCEHQSLPETTTPLTVTPGTGGEDIKIYNRLASSQITTETPGKLRYKDKRLLALYFDMTAMPPPDQFRALDAAMKFIRTDMTTADLVAIMRYAGSSVDVLQDFTDDRNRLLSILQTMVVGEGQGDTASSDDAASSDTGAAFGQDDSEFNIFTTDRQLSALQTAAESLEHLNEKKELLYFASGLTLNGLDNQAQLHATEDAAIRAGVSLWTIDSRGLVAQGAFGDASHGSPGGSSMYTGGAAMAMTSRLQQSQDTLYSLAGDTGGKAFMDNNDLSMGIVAAQHADSDYYILGYYATNMTKNGKYRKIKITMAPELVANLDYRQGYYADKEFDKFTTADKERQLEDALMLEDPMTDLTIAVEINYFQLNRAEYFVPIMMKIPGRELALAKKRGAEHTLIDFIGEIKDDYGGTTVTNIRDHIDHPLTGATAEQWAKVPIEYYSGYTLLPGKYTIKVLARDDETGRIGTFQSSFVVPNLDREAKQVRISSVVLSGRRQPYKDAIVNVAKGKDQVKQAASDPLVQNGQQLLPSVTRVFSKSRSLYVFLQAYESTATAPEPLIAFVSFYQNQTKVYETQPEEVTPPTNTHLQTAPLNFTIDLSQLPPGKYDCQVTVLDPTSQKSTFWRTPIMVTP